MAVSPKLIGLGSGLVTAVLIGSVANGSVLALLLCYVLPLPMLLAGAGWGLPSALLAMATSTILLSLVQNLQTALMFVIFVGSPSIVLIYLLHLRREFTAPRAENSEDENNAGQPSTVIVWYPLGRIIAWASVMAGGLICLTLLMISGGDYSRYLQLVATIFTEETFQQFQNVFGSEITLEQTRIEVAQASPRLAAEAWLAIMIVNLWLAMKSASISDLLPRPFPSVGRIEYPPFMLAGFAAALVITFIPGMFGLLGSAFAGAMGLALVLLGLTVVHALLADSPFKTPALIGVYIGLLFTPFVAPPLLGLGIAEPFLRLREKRAKKNPPPMNQSDRDI